MLKIIPHKKLRRITICWIRFTACRSWLAFWWLQQTCPMIRNTCCGSTNLNCCRFNQWDKYTLSTAHAATRCIYFWDFKVICEIQGFSTFYRGWQIHNPCCIEKPYKMSIVMSLDGCTFLCYQSCLMSYQTVVYMYWCVFLICLN